MGTPHMIPNILIGHRMSIKKHQVYVFQAMALYIDLMTERAKETNPPRRERLGRIISKAKLRVERRADKLSVLKGE